jgi:glycosyltransferase involved in cell wall biosynthesis
MPRPLRIDTAIQFFPRGGSSIVVDYLNRELATRSAELSITCGSLGAPGQTSHAATFYRNLPIHPYDYTPAADAHRQGRPSMDGQTTPFHPSFEDRGPAAPDRQATAVAPATYRHLTSAWHQHLALHRSPRPDVLHLHHLSHLQQAATRAYPGTARLTTLHGTDLKLLQQAHEVRALAAKAHTTPTRLADHLPTEPLDRTAALTALAAEHGLSPQDAAQLRTTDWRLWRHTGSWITAMERWSRHCGTLVTVSSSDRQQAARLLRVPEQSITVIPNGVDLTRFKPTPLDGWQRLQLLSRWLVDDPHGWAPGSEPGSLRYHGHDLARFLDSTGKPRPIVLWVGRYQRVKRLDQLLEAFASLDCDPAPVLLLWGGAPGECEGEHPASTAARLGISDRVFLLGWRGHDELPLGLAVADVMAAPAVGESFGMVYIEAMAAGCPPIATRTGGPADLITSTGPHANGWTVRPDDPLDLTTALRQALADPADRAQRSHNAISTAARYSWTTIADRYLDAYQHTLHRARRSA